MSDPTPKTDSDEIAHSDVVHILKKKNKSPKDIEVLDKRFEKIKFFAEFRSKIEPESFQKLLKSLSYEKVSMNQLVFRKGETGDKFYIILKGSIAVILQNKPEEIPKTSHHDRQRITK